MAVLKDKKQSSSGRTYLLQIKRWLISVESLIKSSDHNLSDRDVHQLRVTSRRIHSALNLIEGGDSDRSIEKVSRSLRKIARAHGRRRELDVAIQDADNFGLKLKTLRKKRKKARIKAARTLTKKRRKKLMQNLHVAIEKIESSSVANVTVNRIKLCKRIRPWETRLLRDKNKTHVFRKEIKIARYSIEAMGRPIGPLKQLQGYLGRVHDMEVLSQLIGPCEQAKALEKRELTKAQALMPAAVRFALKQLS